MITPLISLLRMAVLFIVILATSGCGGSDSANGKTKLVWAVSGGDTFLPIYLSTIHAFESKHPNIEVQPLMVAGNYYQKVTVMLAGRTPPDVFWMGQSFSEFAMRGNFLDLANRIANDPDINASDYHPKVLSWYRVNGKQYGIPYGVDIQFIVYNKTLFDEAGIAYPKDDWTLAQFLDAAKKLTIDRDGDGRIDQYGYRGQIPEAMWGAQFVASDGSKATCDTPQMVAWAQFCLDMQFKWKVSPTSEETRAEGLKSDYIVFRQGKAAMMYSATFNIPHLREKCADVDWDIVANPRVPGHERAHWASSGAYLIAADTKHPDEAWLFAKHLLGEQFQTAMTIESFPANRPVGRKYALENTLKPANLKCIVDAMDYLYPNPRIANLNELLEHWTNAKQKVFQAHGTNREVTPEKAFTEAARLINKTIAKRKR